MINWADYPNFTKAEFDCKETGKNEMQKRFVDVLQAIRTEFGKPMAISSGYRDQSHPAERNKSTPGAHTYGCAADVAVSGGDAQHLMYLAYKHGIRRIGVSQKGSGRFLHFDMAEHHGFPSPALWSY
ncbi:D-Ala-D-Ala carboxypeptidase family metallohydrolase [Paremcibacter congregatus]|uniref:D-Ala-D-Ala carboxypeptidase family metallohydrolase n=1 Tax=Paremcibacter congregatus TaxID=2043170 RepID=UPI003A8DFA98